jgi:pimeloyl-ACP methyl ester carboxylesterase
MTTASDDAPFTSELKLHTVQHEGRDITFSTSPDNGSQNVLFCYPVGAGRRMLLLFRSLFADIRFICINRPGKGGTSVAIKGKTHLETVLEDMIAVLNELEIRQVSILTMCAGTPFAMAFASRYPDRTTGCFIGISSWVQPADCGYDNTKVIYHVGTKRPSFTGPLAGSFMSSMGFMFSSFPTTWFAGLVQTKLSKEEAQVFQERYSEIHEFSDVLTWMRQDSRGGVSPDISVLLSANVVDYPAFSKSCKTMIFFHGTGDTMVPHVGIEWLAEQLPNAALHTMENGTHEGCMFLLHPKIVESIKVLGRDTDSTS